MPNQLETQEDLLTAGYMILIARCRINDDIKGRRVAIIASCGCKRLAEGEGMTIDEALANAIKNLAY